MAFIVAGIPPIVGAGFMCLIYRMKNPSNRGTSSSDDVNIEALGKNEMKNETSAPTLMQSLTATSALSAETALETESLLVKNGKYHF